jgi:hypothetical protein
MKERKKGRYGDWKKSAILRRKEEYIRFNTV